jgi:hypothetical protein
MRRLYTLRDKIQTLRVFPSATWLLPVAWGSLMVGIAMSGVLADYLLRPSVDYAYRGICRWVARSPNTVDFLNRNEGPCRQFFPAAAVNQCLSPEKDRIIYSLKNEDGSISQWIGRYSQGKIESVTETLLNADESTVETLPLQYEFENQNLVGLRGVSGRLLAKDQLRPEVWNRSTTIAGVMRNAINLCRPGLYDRLLKPVESLASLQIDKDSPAKN